MGFASNDVSAERAIFDVFALHQLRAGQVMPAGLVYKELRNRGIPSSDAAMAFDELRESGWIVPAPSEMVRLTEKGFCRLLAA